MSENNLDPNTVEGEVNQLASLGDVLKSARVSKKWTIHDAAHKLKISPEKIQKIESNHINDELRQVYFRGYIRNYARLLCVDVSAQLGQISTVQQSNYTERELNGAIDLPVYQHKRNQQWFLVRFFRLLVPCLLVIFVVLWWNEQSHHRSSTIPLPSVPTSELQVNLPQLQDSTNNGKYQVTRVTSGTVAGT